MRVHIVGLPSSGKTTLAKGLSAHLNVPKRALGGALGECRVCAAERTRPAGAVFGADPGGSPPKGEISHRAGLAGYRRLNG